MGDARVVGAGFWACRLKRFMVCVGLLPVLAASQQPQVGSTAPELRLEAVFQAPRAKLDLQSLRGNVVVLEFWATWCAPCISAMPHLNELAAKFADRPVRFLAISNETPAKVEAFLKKGLLKTWVGADPSNATFEAYGVRAIPKTVVIGRDGKIALVTRPSELREQVLTDLLDGRAPLQSSAGQPSAMNATQPPLYALEIRPSTEISATTMIDVARGRLEMNGVSLAEMLPLICEVSRSRFVVEGSLPEDRYGVRAYVGAKQGPSLLERVREVVEDVFGLQLRRERRSLPVLVLSAPSGPGGELRPSTDERSKSSTSAGVISAQGMPIEALVSTLEHLLGVPVMDDTRLKGRFNWLLTYDAANPRSVLTALQPLGLSVREETREVEVVVVRPRGG